MATVTLLPHKAACLQELIDTYLPLHHTSRKFWQKMLSQLQHLATAIPGAQYLFSLLQNVLKDQPNSTRLRLSPLVIASLRDWLALAHSLATHPTPI